MTHEPIVIRGHSFKGKNRQKAKRTKRRKIRGYLRTIKLEGGK